MRKCIARAAVAIAATAPLIGIPAVASAKAHAKQKHDVVVVSRHKSKSVLFVKHARRNADAHIASCLAGQLTPAYCTPPKEDTLFGAFSTGGTATFGSTNYNTCRQLGYPSAPCGVYTNATNELLVAFGSADGPSSGGQTLGVSCTTAGGGSCPVTWHHLEGEAGGLGDSDIWYADASSIISKAAPIFVTASLGKPSGCIVNGHSTTCDVSLNVVTFQNAITAGASGAQGTGIGAGAVCYSPKAAPSCSLKTTEPDSWVWGVGNDWGGAQFRTVPSGQNALVQIEDLTARKTFWLQSTTFADPSTLAIGSTVTINDTAPTTDPFNEALVEIL